MQHHATFVTAVLLCQFLVTSVESAETKSADASLEYLHLRPNFVVNLRRPNDYLRTDVELLVSGRDNLERIRRHLPALRHALILLFSDYTPEQLTTAAQRERLRKAALQTVRSILDPLSSSRGLSNLFFTEFLIQQSSR